MQIKNSTCTKNSIQITNNKSIKRKNKINEIK